LSDDGAPGFQFIGQDRNTYDDYTKPDAVCPLNRNGGPLYWIRCDVRFPGSRSRLQGYQWLARE